MRIKLPPTWEVLPIKAVAEVVTGKTPSTKVSEFFGEGIPFVTPPDLDKDEPITKAGASLTALGASQINVVPQSSVLVCCIGSLGKIGFAGSTLATNQQINSIVFDESKVVPRFGFHYCRTLKPMLEKMAPATTVKIVNKGNFQELEIPLPPLPEQRRIAAILDKADAIRCKRQQAIRLTEDFLRSVFLDMFGDPVTNPKGWEVGTIRDLVSEVKYGSSGKAGPEGQYPMLRMNNLTYDGGWDFSSLKYIDLPEKDLGKYLVQKGDLLFNRTNSKELVGKTAVFDQEEPMAYAGYLIRVRPNEGNTNEYISGYLNSEHGKQTLVGTCKSIVGMANINAQELQNIKILKAPPEDQKKYQAIVKSVQSFRKTLDEPVALTDSLFNSLVQRAFRGDL